MVTICTAQLPSVGDILVAALRFMHVHIMRFAGQCSIRTRFSPLGVTAESGAGCTKKYAAFRRRQGNQPKKKKINVDKIHQMETSAERTSDEPNILPHADPREISPCH
jgi:hypothetical protein